MAETIEALRRRIESVENLGSIVGTMKALSAMKIRQYEKAVESLSEYTRTIELGLYVALGSGPIPPGARAEREGGPTGRVVFGSDQGLCGRFNEEIAELVVADVGPSESRGPLLAVGSRVAERLGRRDVRVDEELSVPGSVEMITELVRTILLRVDAWREQAGLGRVLIYHNRPEEGGGYEPTRLQLLPLSLERFRYLKDGEWPTRQLPTHTMARGPLLAALMRQHLFASLFRRAAESLASENASRLSAMQSAESNIEDRLDELEGRHRRLRQQQITGELLDIVAGFEALTGAGGRDDEAEPDAGRVV